MENINLIDRKRETFSEFNVINGLVEPKLRKKIRITVLSIHFGLLLFLILWYLISNYLIAKKPSVIQVTLVTPQKSAFNPAPASPQPTPKAAKPKRKVKPRPKPKPKPKPKAKPRPKKKKTTYLNPNQIKISKKEIKNDPVADLVPLSASDLEKNLTNKYLKNRNKITMPQGNNPPGNISKNYLDQVSSLMYQTWQQPKRSEIGSRQPTVDVEITVESSGRISKSRIVRKSGLSAMDISAYRLLKDLKSLPRPPNGKTTFTVTLEIVRD